MASSLEPDGVATPTLAAGNITGGYMPDLSQLNIDLNIAPAAAASATTGSSSSHAPALLPRPLRHVILVPLYIYPATHQSWAPLELAARAHPELDFVTVVNLDNGPGWMAAPDANYTAAMRRLRALPNVRLVGYVYASFGVRPVGAVWHDLCIYRGWETVGPLDSEELTAAEQGTGAAAVVSEDKGPPALRLDGVFFDEAPSEPDYVAYMDALAYLARTALDPLRPPPAPCADEDAEAEEVTRLLVEREVRRGQETGGHDSGDGDAVADAITVSQSFSYSSTTASSPPFLVIYNPGVIIPDSAFFSSADYIIVFENYGSEWMSPTSSGSDMAEYLDALPAEMRARSIVVGHSFGESGGISGAKKLARDVVRRLGLGGQFAATNYGYREWCPGWMEYVDEVGRLVSEGAKAKAKGGEVTS